MALRKFTVKPVGRHAAMMILAVSAMALPAVFAGVERSALVREELSVAVAVILLASYGAYLFYSYFSLRARERTKERPQTPLRKSVGVSGGRSRHWRGRSLAPRSQRSCSFRRSSPYRGASG